MNLRLLDIETDIQAVVDLINPYESEPIDEEQFVKWCRRLPPGRDIRRVVAVDEQGQVVGYNYANHETWDPQGVYAVWAVVRPDLRRRGLGTALLEDAVNYAAGRGAVQLRTEVRESDAVSHDFVQRQGFVFDRHQFESTLDLQAFDETPFLPVAQAVAASGIRVQSLAELGNTRENRRKLYEVNYTTALDIPGFSGWFSFEEFEQAVAGATWFNPEGQLGALDGDRWIGLSAVQLIADTHDSYNLMTGVLREYRGRGIALALKLAAIRYARAAGARSMRTNNDSQNAAILAVNRKLGYAPLPGLFILKKEIKR